MHIQFSWMSVSVVRVFLFPKCFHFPISTIHHRATADWRYCDDFVWRSKKREKTFYARQSALISFPFLFSELQLHWMGVCARVWVCVCVSACAAVCVKIDPIEIEMKKVRKSNYIFWKVKYDWMVFILLMPCDRSNESGLALVRNAQTSCQPRKMGEKKSASLYN